VEDSDDYRDDIVKQLEKSSVAHGGPPRVVSVKHFREAIPVLSSQTVDVLILDVREDNGDDYAGQRVLEKLQEVRFVPVVFYTAYSDRVTELAQEPVIQVVGKGEKTSVLLAAVKSAFDSGLPAASRGISDHVREVTREYMWNHISQHWAGLARYSIEDKTAMLTARLARTLDLTLAIERTEALRGPIGHALAAKSRWHPSRIYIFPPMGGESDFDTGDVLHHRTSDTYWVQLTPACDLANEKASRHLLVAASPLLAVNPFDQWHEADNEWRNLESIAPPKGGWRGEEQKKRKLLKSRASTLRSQCTNILQGKIERFFFLPHFLEIPDLLLDLQHVTTPENEQMAEYQRVAGLAAPWPQVLANRYNRHTGRIGYDDPDVQEVMDRLRGQI
jgi:CheY-like chemotaxis protein